MGDSGQMITRGDKEVISGEDTAWRLNLRCCSSKRLDVISSISPIGTFGCTPMISVSVATGFDWSQQLGFRPYDEARMVRMAPSITIAPANKERRACLKIANANAVFTTSTKNVTA